MCGPAEFCQSLNYEQKLHLFYRKQQPIQVKDEISMLFLTLQVQLKTVGHYCVKNTV